MSLATIIEVREAPPDRQHAERYWIVQDGVPLAYFGKLRGPSPAWHAAHVDGRREDTLPDGEHARNVAIRFLFPEFVYVSISVRDDAPPTPLDPMFRPFKADTRG